MYNVMLIEEIALRIYACLISAADTSLIYFLASLQQREKNNSKNNGSKGNAKKFNDIWIFITSDRCVAKR